MIAPVEVSPRTLRVVCRICIGGRGEALHESGFEVQCCPWLEEYAAEVVPAALEPVRPLVTAELGALGVSSDLRKHRRVAAKLARKHLANLARVRRPGYEQRRSTALQALE